MDDEKFNKFIEECASFCRKCGFKTKQELKSFIVKDILSGKDEKNWKVASIKDRMLEALCKRLGIK